MAEKKDAASSLKFFVTLLALSLTVGILYFAKEILLPVALAALLSFVLTPPVTWLERRGLSRIPAVMLVTMLAFSAMGAVSWLAARQIVQLSHQLPNYKDNLIVRVRSLRGIAGGDLAKAQQALEDIGDEWAKTAPAKPRSINDAAVDDPNAALLPGLQPEIQPRANDQAVAVKVVAMPPSPLSQIGEWLGPLVAPLSTAGITVVLVIVMLVKREDLRNRLIQIFGTSRLYATTEAIDDATRRLSNYLRMQLLINIIYGVCVAVGLAAIGVPNAFLWGVLGTLLRFLPYVGPWIAAAMPCALSLAVSRGWAEPILAVSLYVVLELVVNHVLEPWLYGTSAGVSTFGVMLAAIFWAWLWGPIGLVLAMPLTVCFVVLGKYVPQLSFLPVLLGDRSTLQPHEHLYQRLLSADDLEAGRLAEEHLKSASLIDFYDNVLIPALHLGERDRNAGLLSDEQETIVVDSARELIEELGTKQAAETPANEEPRRTSGSVLCVPVRDQADETAAQVLKQLLTAEGFAAELNAHATLVGEMLKRIDDEQIRVVVLAVLPPMGSRNARFLTKRLRKHDAKLQIILALLGGAQLKNTQKRLQESGANVVTTTLPETLVAVQEACALNIPAKEVTPSAVPEPHVKLVAAPV